MRRPRQVALACYEHRVLTTEQLRRLHFRSSRRAELRLAELSELRVLDASSEWCSDHPSHLGSMARE